MNFFTLIHCGKIAKVIFYIKNLQISYVDPNPEVKDQLDSNWSAIIKKLDIVGFPDPINLTTSFVPPKQSAANIAKAILFLENIKDPFQLAGFEHLTRTFKSFLLPLALFHDLISVKEAIDAANLELSIQSERWGVLEDHHLLNKTQMSKNASLGHVFLT